MTKSLASRLGAPVLAFSALAACSGSDVSNDAGSISDSGMVDTGALVDVGATDAGSTDDGVVDLGPADTGVVDLGPADMGVVDSGRTTPVSFASEIAPMFARRCTRCHGSRRPAAALNLTARAGLWAHIVDQSTRTVACRSDMTGLAVDKIVAPGQPLESVMIRKAASLDSEAACDKEMPPRDGALIDIAPADYELLLLWVEQGALDN